MCGGAFDYGLKMLGGCWLTSSWFFSWKKRSHWRRIPPEGASLDLENTCWDMAYNFPCSQQRPRLQMDGAPVRGFFEWYEVMAQDETLVAYDPRRWRSLQNSWWSISLSVSFRGGRDSTRQEQLSKLIPLLSVFRPCTRMQLQACTCIHRGDVPRYFSWVKHLAQGTVHGVLIDLIISREVHLGTDQRDYIPFLSRIEIFPLLPCSTHQLDCLWFQIDRQDHCFLQWRSLSQLFQSLLPAFSSPVLHSSP